MEQKICWRERGKKDMRQKGLKKYASIGNKDGGSRQGKKGSSNLKTLSVETLNTDVRNCCRKHCRQEQALTPDTSGTPRYDLEGLRIP